MVARQELLDLLTAYYNTAPPEVREKLSNPENCKLHVFMCVCVHVRQTCYSTGLWMLLDFIQPLLNCLQQLNSTLGSGIQY